MAKNILHTAKRDKKGILYPLLLCASQNAIVHSMALLVQVIFGTSEMLRTALIAFVI